MSIDDVLTLLLLVIAAVELGIHIGGRMKWPPPRNAKTATSHAKNVFRSWLTRGNGCHLLHLMRIPAPFQQSPRAQMES